MTSVLSEFVRQQAESGWRADLTKRKKEIQTHWQPEKRENPFRAVVKVLKRKFFDYKTAGQHEL